MRIFAISDIHGCNLTFRSLLHRIQLQQEDELLLLGDYINKGPDPKGVIDTIFELRAAGYQVHCLRGNHEQRLLDIRRNPDLMAYSHVWGIRRTLESFGTDEPAGIPTSYWQFLESLEYYFERDAYLLVHAGFNFSIADPFNDLKAMLYIRNWYEDINAGWLKDRIIVHGHTRNEKDTIVEQYEQLTHQQFLCIDNGCVNVEEAGKGYLCAFELKSRQIIFEPNREWD